MTKLLLKEIKIGRLDVDFSGVFVLAAGFVWVGALYLVFSAFGQGVSAVERPAVNDTAQAPAQQLAVNYDVEARPVEELETVYASDEGDVLGTTSGDVSCDWAGAFSYKSQLTCVEEELSGSACEGDDRSLEEQYEEDGAYCVNDQMDIFISKIVYPELDKTGISADKIVENRKPYTKYLPNSPVACGSGGKYIDDSICFPGGGRGDTPVLDFFSLRKSLPPSDAKALTAYKKELDVREEGANGEYKLITEPAEELGRYITEGELNESWEDNTPSSQTTSNKLLASENWGIPTMSPIGGEIARAGSEETCYESFIDLDTIPEWEHFTATEEAPCKQTNKSASFNLSGIINFDACQAGGDCDWSLLAAIFMNNAHGTQFVCEKGQCTSYVGEYMNAQHLLPGHEKIDLDYAESSNTNPTYEQNYVKTKCEITIVDHSSFRTKTRKGLEIPCLWSITNFFTYDQAKMESRPNYLPNSDNIEGGYYIMNEIWLNHGEYNQE